MVKQYCDILTTKKLYCFTNGLAFSNRSILFLSSIILLALRDEGLYKRPTNRQFISTVTDWKEKKESENLSFKFNLLTNGQFHFGIKKLEETKNTKRNVFVIKNDFFFSEKTKR